MHDVVLEALATQMHVGEKAEQRGVVGQRSLHLDTVIVGAWRNWNRVVIVGQLQGKDPLLWILFYISAFITILTETELVWIFIASGIVTLFVKSPPSFFRKSVTPALIPVGLVSGLYGGANIHTLAQLSLYFAKVGAVVFGSGLAIVPFLSILFTLTVPYKL